MSASDWSDEDWDAFFRAVDPDREVKPGERLKWGWNHKTSEAEVWEVAGPGDGLPTHTDHLERAWGRVPSLKGGDVLGAAYIERPASGDEPTKLHVQVYYRREVPSSVLESLSGSYPDTEITVESL